MVTAAATSADYIDPDSRFVLVGGTHIHYKRSGGGRPILMLHGSGSSLATFDRVAGELSTDFDVIRIDLPGFGLTGPRPDRDYSLPTYTATVAGVLNELAVPHAVVVGNSLGGNIAWNLALDFSDLVDRLVLINATGYPGKSLPLAMRLARHPAGRILLRRLMSPTTTRRNLRSTVGATSVVSDDLVDRVHAMMMRPGNQQAFVDLSSTDHPNRTSELGDITAPTLVLRSASIDGQHFARDIPNACEDVNGHTGHLMPDEDPTWISRRIRSFVTAEERRR